MSERIDHAAEAVKHIEWAHDQQGTDGEFDFTVRDNALITQAEATFALVEQQRVANLIALAGYEHANGSRSYQYAVARPVNEFDLALNEEIKEALGL